MCHMHFYEETRYEFRYFRGARAEKEETIAEISKNIIEESAGKCWRKRKQKKRKE